MLRQDILLHQRSGRYIGHSLAKLVRQKGHALGLLDPFDLVCIWFAVFHQHDAVWNRGRIDTAGAGIGGLIPSILVSLALLAGTWKQLVGLLGSKPLTRPCLASRIRNGMNGIRRRNPSCIRGPLRP